MCEVPHVQDVFIFHVYDDMSWMQVVIQTLPEWKAHQWNTKKT